MASWSGWRRGGCSVDDDGAHGRVRQGVVVVRGPEAAPRRHTLSATLPATAMPRPCHWQHVQLFLIKCRLMKPRSSTSSTSSASVLLSGPRPATPRRAPAPGTATWHRHRRYLILNFNLIKGGARRTAPPWRKRVRAEMNVSVRGGCRRTRDRLGVRCQRAYAVGQSMPGRVACQQEQEPFPRIAFHRWCCCFVFIFVRKKRHSDSFGPSKCESEPIRSVLLRFTARRLCEGSPRLPFETCSECPCRPLNNKVETNRRSADNRV